MAIVDQVAAAEEERRRERIISQAQDILWAVNGVLRLSKEKVTPMSGPQAGKRIKVKIDPVEKLVRIRAAMLTLEKEVLENIEFEAHNRVTLSAVTARKPWE